MSRWCADGDGAWTRQVKGGREAADRGAAAELETYVKVRVLEVSASFSSETSGRAMVTKSASLRWAHLTGGSWAEAMVFVLAEKGRFTVCGTIPGHSRAREARRRRIAKLGALLGSLEIVKSLGRRLYRCQ